MRKALFLDMDHTIIRPKSGERFPTNYDDWEFIPGVLSQIKKFVDKGYLPIVVSNQGGISKGLQSEKGINYKFSKITKQMAAKVGSKVPYTYAAKYDNSRKPKPGMAMRAKSKFDIDVPNSIMVGDMDTDKGFAKSAGIKTYYDIKKFLALR